MKQPAKAGFALAVVGTLGMAFALGGAHAYALVAVAPLALTGAILALVDRRSRPTPRPVLIGLGLAGYTMLQAIPLPLAILEWVSPQAADVWSRALHPFGEEVSWGALSLDPGASVREALKWFLYSVLLFAAIRSVSERGQHVVALVVFCCSLAVALVTLGHGLVDSAALFGLYHPTFDPARWRFGPLLNPNNLSGYLNLGAFSGLGLIFASRLARFRWLLSGGVAILFGVSVLTGSRAGVLLLPVGLIAFLVLLSIGLRRKHELRWRQGYVPVLAACLCGLILAGLGASEVTWKELVHGNLDKLKMAMWVVPMLGDFPVFGIGRGAFESAFAAYAPATSNGLYQHPENFVVQWCSEWGLVIGVGALAGFGWALRGRDTRILGSSVSTGAAVSVLLLLLHNLVDLSLEVPAVAMLLMWALAALRNPLRRQRRYRRHRTSRNADVEAPGEASEVASERAPASLRSLGVRALRPSWQVLGVCGAVLWLATLWRGRVPLSEEREELEQLAQAELASGSKPVETWKQLRRAMLAHPAEPYFVRLGGAVAVAVNDPRSMAWIQRALELWPLDAGTHILAARALRQRNVPMQALFHLRRAVELDPSVARVTGKLAGQWSADWDDLMRAVPPGPVGAIVLTGASRAVSTDRAPELKARLLRKAIERDASYHSARRAYIATLLEQVRRGKCTLDACGSEALRHADQLRRQRLHGDAVVLYARVLNALGRWGEAKAFMATECGKLAGPERVRCLRGRLQLLGEVPKPSVEAVSLAASELAEAACLYGPCARELIEAGDAFRDVGDWRSALAAYERASREEPGVPVLLRMAEAASRMGRMALADSYFERAERFAGRNSRALQRVLRERRRLGAESRRRD